MKLYATTTSERASKGQGGNKYIDANFTIEQMGKRLEVVRVIIEQPKDGEYKVKVWLPKHKSTETVLKLNQHHNLYVLEERVRDDQKGKQKKGECTETEWSKTCTGCKHCVRTLEQD